VIQKGLMNLKKTRFFWKQKTNPALEFYFSEGKGRKEKGANKNYNPLIFAAGKGLGE